MAKSVGNYVGIDEPPEEQFGKVMSIPDDATEQWWRLCLDRESPGGDPMESKLALARGIVERYHGAEAAASAEEHFSRVVREHKPPEVIPPAPLPEDDPVHLPWLLTGNFGVRSTSEARRLVEQGGVRVNGEVITTLDVARDRLKGAVVQVGRRQFRQFPSA
jgi:tyrosyl-tRNA synthetase